MKQLESAGKLKNILGETLLETTDKGFFLENNNSKSEYFWSGIISFQKIENYILIEFGIVLIVIPNRAFNDDIQKAEFVEILKANIGSKKEE